MYCPQGAVMSCCVAKSNNIRKNGGIEYLQLDDVTIELTSENLLVTMQGKDGFAFSGEGEIGVVLETALTPELIEEGYVREVLSKVQNMRKDKGFEVLDKINLYVSGNSKIEDIVKNVYGGSASFEAESATKLLGSVEFTMLGGKVDTVFTDQGFVLNNSFGKAEAGLWHRSQGSGSAAR